MLTVLLWELNRRKSFTFWWSIGVSALIAMTVLSFLAIKDQSAQLDQAMAGMTSSMGNFFGSSDFFSPVGYLSSQIYYIMLPLLLIILVVTLASSLMNRDEADNTIELTLSQPVSRTSIIAGKAIAGIIIISIVMIVSFIVIIICAKIAGLEIDFNNLFLTHLISFAFSLSFGVVSFSFMAMSNMTRRFANILAILFSFGGYIIVSLSGFVKQLEFTSKLMPYHYYNTTDLLNGKVESGLIIYIAIIFLLGAILAWIGYNKRDIGQ